MRETLAKSDIWGPAAGAATVEVPTAAVAKAGLLKSTIDITDLNTYDESKVVAAVTQLEEVQRIAEDNGVFLSARAIYIVEESDRKSGEPRPVTLWKLLTDRCGVLPQHIAVATSTRELPKEAERVSDLAQLRPRHRHVIFNKKFQEGWDDPEVYVAYFDGETKSAIRIRQIIGRVIRQPNALHFAGLPDLNTAFLFVSSPDAKFTAIVENIKLNHIEEYGRDENGESNVKVRRSSERPGIVRLRAGLPPLSLPDWPSRPAAWTSCLRPSCPLARGPSFPPTSMRLARQFRSRSI
jgi:type III restriction enzyme